MSFRANALTSGAYAKIAKIEPPRRQERHRAASRREEFVESA
ncbi:hypothetical protein [Nostoc sp.]